MTASRPDEAAVVRLELADEPSRQLWRDAISVMQQLPGAWTLVGGLMVQLHCIRAGLLNTRATIDIDILADSRRRPSATEGVGAHLREIGFTIDETVVLRNPPTAFRFRRGDVVVDLLAPDHTGSRKPPLSVEGFQTIEVAGGTQALLRSESIRVVIDDLESRIRCPSLLGAILMKTRVVERGYRRHDRDDLLALLSCVADPILLADELKGNERAWLRRIESRLDLDDSTPGSRLSPSQGRRAEAAYRLLTQAKH